MKTFCLRQLLFVFESYDIRENFSLCFASSRYASGGHVASINMAWTGPTYGYWGACWFVIEGRADI